MKACEFLRFDVCIRTVCTLHCRNGRWNHDTYLILMDKSECLYRRDIMLFMIQCVKDNKFHIMH